LIVIVDAGPLIAAADRRDPDSLRCLEALSNRRYDLVVPAMCVAEAAFMIAKRAGPMAEATFIAGLADLDVLAPTGLEWRRIAELVRQYADFPIGATDASIVALAERLGTDTVMTLDRRHFRAIVPTHCPAFRLLPE
jgi:hypothetical protein